MQFLFQAAAFEAKWFPAAQEATADPKSKPTSGESIAVRMHVDANAVPGVRDVRVATPRGVSTVGQIVLVADPVVYEQKENDRPELAQKVDTPVTVCGRIEKAEDVDFFRFHVDAGKTLCFHVMCMRLQDRVHDLQQHADPILTIRDSNGAVIAFSDNELHADPLICHTFDRGGDYTMEIRDVRFQGNAFWEYSVEINDRPLAITTYPVGVSHSAVSSPATESPATTSLELIGYGLSGQTREVTLDKGLGRGIQSLPVKTNDSTLCPINLVFSNEPKVTESEGDNESVANAQTINLPSGVNGRIEKAGDLDYFAFDANERPTLLI